MASQDGNQVEFEPRRTPCAATEDIAVPLSRVVRERG
jgi:hypothetical protein